MGGEHVSIVRGDLAAGEQGPHGAALRKQFATDALDGFW